MQYVDPEPEPRKSPKKRTIAILAAAIGGAVGALADSMSLGQQVAAFINAIFG